MPAKNEGWEKGVKHQCGLQVMPALHVCCQDPQRVQQDADACDVLGQAWLVRDGLKLCHGHNHF